MGKTPHERNPILYAPREGADYVTCRTCSHCRIVGLGEQPDILMRDLGLCAENGFEPCDPDEPRTGEDAECWEPW